MSRPLRLGFWNLNGYNSRTLGNKLKTKEFLNIINKHDIFAVVETHANYDSELAVNNFKHFVKCRNKSGKRTFGGLSSYINQKLANGVSYIPTENKNTIWCKLNRNYFGFENDIYLGTVYLSPPNYERNNNDDLISEIEAEMLSFSQKGGIIVQGDYNARTGEIQEVVMNDDTTFLPVPEDYEIDSQFFRHSQDSGTVNSRGRNLLEICTALNLRIFNGRIVGDLEGKKTCFHYNGSSVVDYVIGSKAILQNMRYFIVNPLMPHLSDHCHVTYAIKATLTGSPVSSSCSNGCTLSEHYRLLWDTKLKNKLKECLESQIVQSNLQAALKNDNVDTAAELFSETLVEACKKAGLKVQRNKTKAMSQNNWFDLECETEKENLKSLGEQISQEPNNSQLRRLLQDNKKKFKRTCRRKKREFISKSIGDIDLRNPQDAWKQIGKIFNIRKRQPHGTETVSAGQFYEYFKQQNAAPTNGEQTDLKDTGVTEEEAGPLDYAISVEEIDFAIKKVKLNKAPGYDKILNEVLKTGKDIIRGHLLELFNRILSSGKYPTLWSFGLIVPIHKKDDRSKVENYRGITLLSALGKLFTSILNDRLYDYMTKKGVLKVEQGGFKKRHGTVDSIFILKTLIDKFVKSKPQKRRNLLFSCFVDFRKAFDRIPRQKLFEKLRKEGIKGRFLEIVMSMYSKDKSAVKINNKMTEAFPCYTGVKQGCMLSPTLFNLYLSDLPEFLNSSSSTDILLDDSEKPINCLLYADDLVIFSRSANGLQTLLNKLESYCDKTELTVNLDKTKVMIFNNCGKSLNNYSFKYRVNVLNNVKSYKYLGITLNPYGNFSLAREELKKVGLKALYKLRREMGYNFRENIMLTIKLFDALISPILLYGSEIWGVDCSDQIEKDPAELVQIKFLKWLLGVNKYCSNNAYRAETGRFPMKIEAQYRNFKFWLTLTKHPKHKLSQVAYNDVKSRMNKELWSQKIKRVLDQIGLGYLWTKAHENGIGILNIIKQRLKDIELQRWLSEVNNDVRKDANQKNKLRTFRKFKTIETYKCEDYLRQVTNVQHRITLTKLRLSNHNLAIETGRYVRPYKKPEERICPICKKDVEDERHFLTQCPAYQEKRSTLFEYLNRKYRISVDRMAPDYVFLLLINPPSKNKPVQKLIAKYVFDCYEKRRSLAV